MSWIGSARCSDVFDAPSSWPACAVVVLPVMVLLAACGCAMVATGRLLLVALPVMPVATRSAWQWNLCLVVESLWATVLMITGGGSGALIGLCAHTCACGSGHPATLRWATTRVQVPLIDATNQEPGHIILDWINGLRMAVASSGMVLSSTNHQSGLLRRYIAPFSNLCMGPLVIVLLRLHRFGSDGHIGHQVQHAADRQTPDRRAGRLGLSAVSIVQFSPLSKPCKPTTMTRAFLLRSNHPLPAWLSLHARLPGILVFFNNCC
jgi:hypothetical protein